MMVTTAPTLQCDWNGARKAIYSPGCVLGSLLAEAAPPLLLFAFAQVCNGLIKSITFSVKTTHLYFNNVI